MSKAEEFYRETNNFNNIVLSYAQQSDILMLEAYHQSRVNSISSDDIMHESVNNSKRNLLNEHWKNGAKWFKEQLLKK
jgi:hypothetical protein